MNELADQLYNALARYEQRMNKEDEGVRKAHLGQLAYKTYCAALGRHQDHRCVLWHRLPSNMQEIWIKVAEIIERKALNPISNPRRESSQDERRVRDQIRTPAGRLNRAGPRDR